MGNRDDYVKPPKKNDYVAPPKSKSSMTSTPNNENKTYVTPPKKQQSVNKGDYVKPPKKNIYQTPPTKVQPTGPYQAPSMRTPSKGSGFSLGRWIIFILGIFFINEAIQSTVDMMFNQIYTTLWMDYNILPTRALSVASIIKYSFYFAYYWLLGGSVLKIFLSIGETIRRYSIFRVLLIISGLAFIYNWNSFVGFIGLMIALVMLSDAKN